MTTTLQATDELATQLSLVHSVLQFEGDLSFEAAVKATARELNLSRGYVELLIEILVERDEFKFVHEATEVGNNHYYRLQFIGGQVLDIDIFDLERINLGEVSKHLADRMTLLKADLKKAGAADREAAKLNNELARTERMINSAKEALERRRASKAVAEQKVAHFDRKINQIEGELARLTEQRERQRREQGLPSVSQDNI